MKVLLVQPPIGKRIVSKTPPVGIAYIAAMLESIDCDVECLPCDVLGMGIQDAVQEILKAKPDVVGFSVASLVANSVMSIVHELRQSGFKSPIIAGGPHSTIYPEKLLESGVTYVVRGEGEITVVELIKCLNDKSDLAKVDGISYLDEGEIVNTENRKLIKNLDTLPLPAWHLLPIDKYRSDFKISNRSLPVLTSRGCPGKCVFCYKSLFGSIFRTRSASSIVDEIETLKDKYNIDEFSIVDDNFVCSKKRAIEVCKLLIERKINLPWSLPSGIRVDMVDYELLSWIKRAGCYRLGFGVESGNQSVLYAIRKNITKDQVRLAIKLAKEFGFITSAFFMIGNLGETESTVNDTIEFALELDPDIAQFSVATPYPGTEMFDILHEQKKILTYDWGKYDGFSAQDPIFKHDQLDAESISRLMHKAYLKFYLRYPFIKRYVMRNMNLSGLGKMARSGLKFFKIIRH